MTSTDDPRPRIEAALAVLLAPDQVVELRALRWGSRKRTAAGFYSDPCLLARDAARLTATAEGVYITLNPVNPDLLARCANRFEEQYGGGELTSDKDMLRRRWLLVDFDAIRPSKISATETEHEAALQAARTVRQALRLEGWPDPVLADSGNGGHLLYRIDLPVADNGLVERCLKALALEFETDGVKVDTTTFSPAQICKLYGTQSRKGDHLPQRPYRWSDVLEVPATLQPVGEGLLAALATRCPQEPPKDLTRTTYSSPGAAIDVEAFLRQAGLLVRRDGPWQSGHKWLLVACPFDPSHTDKSAVLVQFPSGAVAFRCQHDSCRGYDWAALRARYAPARPALTVVPRPALPATNGHTAPVALAAPPPPLAPAPVADPSPADLPPEPNSDLLSAGLYWAREHGDQWGYDPAVGVWRRWTGTHWKALVTKDPELDAQAAAILRRLGMTVSSTSRIDGAIRLAARPCTRAFAAPPGLINFTNGTLDTQGGGEPMLRAFDPADNLTTCLPYAWIPGAHPTIDHFLEETIPDALARQAFLVHLGLALLGDLRLHYVLLLLGPPRSGKSTLLQLGNTLAGNEPSANAGPELFDRASEGLRSRAAWNGRRLVTIEELPVEALRNEELVKAMIAHGGVAQRRLHAHEDLNNQWTPKLMMATNEAPRYTDRSGALTARLVPVRCPNARPVNGRDVYLFDRLRPEIPAWAATCLAAAQAVLATVPVTYPFSEAMRAELDTIEQQGDALKSFVGEECLLDPDGWTDSASLYAAYQHFCEENGNRPVSKNKLTGALADRYHVTPELRRLGDGAAAKVTRGVAGVRLRHPVGTDSDAPKRTLRLPGDPPVTAVTAVTADPLLPTGDLENVDSRYSRYSRYSGLPAVVCVCGDRDWHWDDSSHWWFCGGCLTIFKDSVTEEKANQID